MKTVYLGEANGSRFRFNVSLGVFAEKKYGAIRYHYCSLRTMLYHITCVHPIALSAWCECRDQVIGDVSHGRSGSKVELVDGDENRHAARWREGDIAEGAL